MSSALKRSLPDASESKMKRSKSEATDVHVATMFWAAWFGRNEVVYKLELPSDRSKSRISSFLWHFNDFVQLKEWVKEDSDDDRHDANARSNGVMDFHVHYHPVKKLAEIYHRAVRETPEATDAKAMKFPFKFSMVIMQMPALIPNREPMEVTTVTKHGKKSEILNRFDVIDAANNIRLACDKEMKRLNAMMPPKISEPLSAASEKCFPGCKGWCVGCRPDEIAYAGKSACPRPRQTNLKSPIRRWEEISGTSYL